MTQQYNKTTFKPIHIIIILFITIFIILVFYSFNTIFNNPYKNSPRLFIDNMSSFYKSMPDDEKNSIYVNLYRTAALNIVDGEKVPTSGAIIRDHSPSPDDYNSETNVHSGNFIVDIEAIHQSFKINYKWSNNPDNLYIINDSVTISCLLGQQSAYNSTYCRDETGQNDPLGKLLNKNPIITSLPIEIDQINDTATKYTHYKISYRVNDDNSAIVLIITDYTGGNRSAALQKVREYGYDPENYKIEYTDESNYQVPGRAPGAAQ